MSSKEPLILGESTKVSDEQQSGAYDKFLDSLDPVAKDYFAEQTLKSNREALRQEVIDKGVTSLKDDDTTMFKAPQKGCRHCYGEGRVGWSADTHEVIICNCMRQGKLLDSKPEDFINMKAFLKIFNIPKPPYPRAHTTPKSLRRIESRAKKLAKKRRI